MTQKADFKWAVTVLRPDRYGGKFTLPLCDGADGGWLEPDTGQKRNGVTRTTTARTTSSRPRSNITFTWEWADIVSLLPAIEFCQGKCRFEATGVTVDSFGDPVEGAPTRSLAGVFGTADGGEYDITSGDDVADFSLECPTDE